MQNRLLALVEQPHQRDDIPEIRIGDTIIVHQKILDGQKERVQTFEGDVIARSGAGIRETLTIRRLVQGEGVERIIPIHSPRVAKFEVKKAGKVRRAKLFYIRERVGKATRIKNDAKRQVQIDTAAKAAAEAAAKASAEAARAAREAAGATGGESKRSQKRKARAEAQKR